MVLYLLCQSFQSDVFETRLLGEKAICMKGKEAAKLFYDNNKFKRAGAAPKRAQKTLLGEGGVQGLDGKPHRHRKSMFMSMMNDESLEKMRQLIKYEWKFAARHFTDQKEIILYEESKKIIMRAICSWAGVPLKEDEVKKWSDNMAAMFETPVSIGLEQHKGRKARRDDRDFEAFVQEVRRFYPFFPFNGAKVKEDFVWNGYKFEKDTLTLLDFYGTNHDPNFWDNTELFKPDRYINWEEHPFTLIPQGGGDHHTGHRCPGEWITIDIMKTSIDYLANELSYEVPEQDFSYSLVEIPSLIKSGFVMSNIKRK